MKFSLFIIFIAIALGYKAWEENFSNYKANYLYFESINLDNHIVSSDFQMSKPSIFILGSSGTAGSNVPQGTTLADYFNEYQNYFFAYNLAVLQANLIDSIIIYKKGLKHKIPKYVFLGIGPDMFSETSGSLLALSEANNLDAVFPLDIVKNIKNQKKSKIGNKFFIERLANTNLPNPIILKIRTHVYNFRESFYGDVMDKNLTGQKGISLNFVKTNSNPYRLLKLFKELCNKNGTELIVFLEPQLWISKIYGTSEFNFYRHNITKYLIDEKISYLDYIDLVPNNAHFFYDFIHMKPAGYELLAKKINEDFIKIKVAK